MFKKGLFQKYVYVSYKYATFYLFINIYFWEQISHLI